LALWPPSYSSLDPAQLALFTVRLSQLYLISCTSPSHGLLYLPTVHLVDRHSQCEAWSQHGLGEDENGGIITPSELEEVLATVFSLARGDRPQSVLNVERATQVCLTWALSVIDRSETADVQVVVRNM